MSSGDLYGLIGIVLTGLSGFLLQWYNNHHNSAVALQKQIEDKDKKIEEIRNQLYTTQRELLDCQRDANAEKQADLMKIEDLSRKIEKLEDELMETKIERDRLKNEVEKKEKVK